MEIKAKISYGYLTPPLPRTVESCDALRQERNDLDEAGYFGKKNPLESEIQVHVHVYTLNTEKVPT